MKIVKVINVARFSVADQWAMLRIFGFFVVTRPLLAPSLDPEM